MYSGTATSDKHSKTIIRVGAATSDKSRITPLCSVPIQTTTTLNIQLFPSSGRDGQNRPVVTAGNSNTLAASGTSYPVNGRSTSQSTQYEAHSQHHIAASNTEFDSRSTASTGSGSTSRDPPVLPKSSQAVIVDVDVHRSADSDESVAPMSTAATAATAAETAGTMTSSFGTETVASTSVYVENSKQPTDAANVGLVESSNHQLPELSTKQNACDCNDTKTAHAVDIGTSTAGLNVVSHVGEATSNADGYVTVTPVTSPRDVCADEEKVDSKADLQTKLAIKTELLHQQSPAYEKRVSDTVENSNCIDGGNKEETDSDDTEENEEENLTPFDDVDYRKKYSTFRFIGWDMLGKLKAMTIKGCRRVLILKNSALLLIFKTSCATNKAGNDRRLLKLMADIAENCAKRLQMMKDIAKPSLSAEHMDSLPLSDGRQTGQHLAEISQLLGENVAITDVAYRFQPSEQNVYLGSYVKGAIESGHQYEIGTIGVVVVLTKKNKYAAVEAFSEQLCQHIANSCPVSLGSFDGDRFDGRVSQCRRRRRGKQSQGHHNEEQLLLQSFTFDPTIIVAEAARRCLVTIDDFLLLQ